MGEGKDEGEITNNITPHLTPLPQGERKFIS